ncbi:MFS transporter [Aeromicrobium sp.]|uniref:MFS transporter n=1 Tax=Aeromicrobium sp. TaxID=1871063 RepID=UPI003C3FB078
MSEAAPGTGAGARLVAASLSATLMPLNSTMIAVALPDISEEFGRDPALVTQALVTSYLIAAVVLQSPAGKVGDRIGHVRMVAAGQLLVAVGALLGFLAPSLLVLIVARILMAAGSAALVPSTLALLRHGLPPERRGRAFGAFGAMMALSAALGPVVGGELVKAFGWPSVFAANLPVLAVSVALGAFAGRVVAEPVQAARPRFDWVGTGLLAAGLTSIILGLRPDGGHVVLLLVVGIGLLVPFALWERRAADPVVAFSLFRSVPFSAGAFLIAVQNLVMYALIFQIPLVAVALFDLEARGTGRLLVSMMLAMVITSPIAGRLTDHLGARSLAIAGSMVALLGIAALAWIDLTSPGQLAPPLVLLGIGLGLTTPAAQSASMSAVGADLAGMAAGIGSTMRYLGGIVGVAVMSLLLDVHGTRAEVVAEHRTLMVVFGGALLFGLLCSAFLPGRVDTPVPNRSAAEPGA